MGPARGERAGLKRVLVAEGIAGILRGPGEASTKPYAMNRELQPGLILATCPKELLRKRW